MKKFFHAMLLGVMAFSLSACGTGAPEPVTSTPGSSPSGTAPSSTSGQPTSAPLSEMSSTDEASSTTQEQVEPENTARRISVEFNGNTVIYQLNDGTAAASLYEQLPLTLEVEDYSTNEKIFYPPQELDTSDSPPAQAGAGTLAYYAPWADVVMFYGDYNENPSLYELGQVVSGGEMISQMSGTITVTAVE